MIAFFVLAAATTCRALRPPTAATTPVRSAAGIRLAGSQRQRDLRTVTTDDSNDSVPTPAHGRSLAQLPNVVVSPAAGFPQESEAAKEPPRPLGEAVRQSLETGPLEALAADAQFAGRTISKMAIASADEVAQGHFLGAFAAATSALSTELEGEDKGKGASFGISMVFVLTSACWIAELVLAKFWNGENQDDVREASESRLFLHALSFARYLMAWHVVLNHFAYGGYTAEQTSMVGEPWAVFCRWGVLAAPWFYMVSGFTNSYSKLVGSQPNVEEDFIHAMIKRGLSWYPFYLIALIWCAIRVATSEAEDWAHFMAHTFTIHGLVWDKESFPFLTGDVWLSWLIAYMLTWAPFHSAMADGTEQAKDSFIWTVFYMSFVIAIPSAILEWIWFAGFPLYSMVQLWPSFAFGQALAFWFVKNCMEQRELQVGPSGVAVMTQPVWVRKKVNEIPVLVRFGATISITIFGLMFFTFSPHDIVPLFGKPVLPLIQKGFQLPFQGLMVVGFAAEVDPLAKLFARRPFRFAEKLTLMTFLFQVPIYNTINDWMGWSSGMTWTFVACLVSFTVAAHFLVERPYRQWRGDRERGENWKESLAALHK